MRLSPIVQIGAAIDDLPSESIEGRADTLVPPLRQFGAVADQVEFGIAEDVASVLLEKLGHGPWSAPLQFAIEGGHGTPVHRRMMPWLSRYLRQHLGGVNGRDPVFTVSGALRAGNIKHGTDPLRQRAGSGALGDRLGTGGGQGRRSHGQRSRRDLSPGVLGARRHGALNSGLSA